jgi:hypothetical protein
MTTHLTPSRFTCCHLTVSVLALLAIGTAGQAQAQATIDQNKALAGSVTPGDTPGFPVTLSMPGAYKLTGNLVVPATVSGVVVTAAGVTLDLNGFSIIGPITCTVSNGQTLTVTCPTGNVSTTGVDFQSTGASLRNGNLRGFWMGASFVGGGAIDSVLSEHNRYHGVYAHPAIGGARTLVTNVRSSTNGGFGFLLSEAMVRGCTAAFNAFDGFAGSDLGVLDSSAIRNGRYGFYNEVGAPSALTVGRSVAQKNVTSDVFNVLSTGGNVAGSAPF